MVCLRHEGEKPILLLAENTSGTEGKAGQDIPTGT